LVAGVFIVETYSRLDPGEILGAIDSAGLSTDGRLLALNSYENRVYQVGLEDGSFVVAKFYRPGRWPDAAILEEHQFTLELVAAELPVVAPLVIGGATLHHHGEFRFALYPRIGGRPPELDQPEHLRQLGRLMARLHNVGVLKRFEHRPTLDLDSYGGQPAKFLLDGNWLPAELAEACRSTVRDALRSIQDCFDRAGDVQTLRLQGDSHAGNILWNSAGPQLLDFDDACMGPAIQDLWMFLSGDRDYMSARLGELLEGYTAFREFDARELNLVEALRTLRMIHHSAWLAKRWDDPAFPRAFPWFNTLVYWQDQILTLREQLALMQEPPLDWK
jgi:Ser/Thr protein kinase RdoA (MazF antagonist)